MDLLTTYISELTRLLHDLDRPFIDELIAAMCDAWRRGRPVLLMGNGGSSSTVSHIAADLQKNVQLESGRALKTLCLTDCTPLLSAWANDTDWENVFAPQVECWTEPGDIVIGVSGSGNSMNVVNGIAAANRCGARTFGLAGYEGGKLKEVAYRCLVARSDSMQRIEDLHMIVLHMAFCAVVERTGAEARSHR